MKETKKIAESLFFLNHGPYKERRPYMKLIHDSPHRSAEYNGYTFQKELWCWVIWKPTDFDKQPQYKGSPLAKVVPSTVTDNIDAMIQILKNQPWIYV